MTPRARQTVSRKSSIANPQGFTLIELLVVISLVALLMAILLPTLARVRRQLKAVACQAKLRQWGLVMKSYTDNYDGKLWYAIGKTVEESVNPWWWWGVTLEPYYRENEDLLLCPMAARRNRALNLGTRTSEYGATFLTWQLVGVYGSYGVNYLVQHPGEDAGTPRQTAAWGTSLVREAADVPVFLDSICWWVLVTNEVTERPPQDELPAHTPAFETELHGVGPLPIKAVCMNRHEGRINALFLDWSVRKVGIKELWTLKWHREWDTAGPWTKRGGVQPEEWPPWMRRFKDY